MCLAQGPQRSDVNEARTRGPLVSSQALYHWATALSHKQMREQTMKAEGLGIAQKIHYDFTLLILIADGAPGYPGRQVLKAEISLKGPLPQALMPATLNLYAVPGRSSWRLRRLWSWTLTTSISWNEESSISMDENSKFQKSWTF